MFEKEAEEYAEINSPFLNKYDCIRVFKDGAEFGYNKAKYDTCLRENTGLKIHNAYVEKKLAEAKELLKRWERLYNTNTVKGIIADTEHFLKEE